MSTQPPLRPLVREVMTADPIVISPELPLHRVRALMLKASIRHLPVVDEKGIIGIVSERDLSFFHAIPGVADDPKREEIDQVLTAPVGVVMKSRFLVDRDVHTVGPDDALATAVDLLVSTGIGSLPVLDEGGEVVGILSTIDVLRWLGDRVLT